jgi:uncharacterized protein (DUF2267 family)
LIRIKERSRLLAYGVRSLGDAAMSESHLPTIDHAVQQLNIWVKKLVAEHHLPERQHGLSALRAVLHALRDRLTADQAVHLGAELPTIVRGIYYEGWHLASNPSGERQLQPFLDRVQKQLPPKFPRDAKGTTEAVFAVLSQELDRGMIVKVIAELPEPLRVLWPDDLRAGA